VEESSHSKKKTDAERLLAKRIGEVQVGRYQGPEADRLTFADLEQMLTDHYFAMRSRDRAERGLKHLRRHLQLYRVKNITTDVLTAYVNARREEGASESSIKYELSTLKKGFSLAIRAEKLDRRPAFPTLTVENTRTGFFEPAEFKALLSELPETLKGLAEFYYLTGWRKNEVLTRQWSNVDVVAGVIRLEPGETKSGKGRVFPFSTLPALRKLLERQRSYTDEVERRTGQVVPWVFHREGRPIRDFRAAWKAACKRAKLSYKIPHDFRRTAVRNLERAGVPRSVAMELVGHQTESVYRRYAIVAERDLSEGTAKLAALDEAQDGDRTVVLEMRTGTKQGPSGG
jgi:integrase